MGNVTLENLPICFKLYNNSNDFLYRVSFYQKRINLEVSHILSDGKGSAEFFKVLIHCYCNLKYNLKIDPNLESSYIEKSEDSFRKYYQKGKRSKEKHHSIYFYKGHKMTNKTRYLEMHLPVSEVLVLAHQKKCTLTVFLVAVLIDSMRDVMSEKELKKTIKIDVPVDLRQFFKSFSSRNYFGLISITYQYQTRLESFDEIIANVNQQFRENLTKEKITQRVNKMVSFEKNLFYRIMPIDVKNLVLSIVNLFSLQFSTTCLSNLGKMNFDSEAIPYIENVNVITSTPNFQFTLCSFENDLSIGISSKYKYNDIIKNFCRFFSKQNLEVVLYGNEVD